MFIFETLGRKCWQGVQSNTKWVGIMFKCVGVCEFILPFNKNVVIGCLRYNSCMQSLTAKCCI